MTPEQKQQAKQLIADWTNVSKTSTPAVWFLNGDCMAGFLRDLIDAPEPEPVAYVTGYYAGYLSIATIDGRVLPAGTALFTAPPAPSVPYGWRPFLTDVITAAGLLEHGKRDNGLAGRIGKFAFDAMRAAQTPAEPPADVARDAERYRWLRDKCRATGEHWGGRWSLVIEGPCPDGDKSSGAIDKAIDAAIKRQGGES